MRKLIFWLLPLLAIPASAAVQTIQVTIGASATQISTVAVSCRWAVFQNNTAADNMRLGDANVSSTRGILLTPGASFFAPPPAPPSGAVNLTNWYVSGTQNDVIDVVCDKVNF